MTQPTSPALSSPLDTDAIRRDFPILQKVLHADKPLVFLDNGASTQIPQQVLDSIIHTYHHEYANVHRGVHQLSELATEAYELAREKITKFLNAESSKQVIFTRGTTESINLVANSYGNANVTAEDEIVVTEMEHHSNLVPWHQLAERTGAKIRFIPITDDGQLQLDTLTEVITEKTKIVAVAAVSNVLGTINPLEPIIKRTHEVGAVIVVDGAQSAPHMVTDVQKLNADFFAFSGHKMCGSSGIGVLYGKRDLLESMPPYQGGGSMIRLVEIDHFTPADLPAKFEAGTPTIVPAIALGRAVEYLTEIGLEKIHEHEQILTKAAYDRMIEMPGMRILGPTPEKRAGLISFTLHTETGREIHGHDLAHLLDRYGVAVRAGHHCTQPLHKRLGLTASTRASFYLYNTLDEVHFFLDCLQEIYTKFNTTSSSSRKRRRRDK